MRYKFKILRNIKFNIVIDCASVCLGTLRKWFGFNPVSIRKFQKHKNPCVTRVSWVIVVPEAGVEPAQACAYRFLRPARLPIPPFGHWN